MGRGRQIQKTASIACPDCGHTREVYAYRTRAEGYTGLCPACYQSAVSRSSSASRYFRNHKMNSWRVNAARRGISWKLSKADLDDRWERQGGRCAITGLHMEIGSGTRTAASLDRIDSQGDYEPDNIQFVCSIINIMKHDLNMEDFRALCRLVLEGEE